LALLTFNFSGVLAVYALQRLQARERATRSGAMSRAATPALILSIGKFCALDNRPRKDSRPDPDALIEQIRAAETKASRGRLGIYFGASARVEKTHACCRQRAS
jgi:hypothetical protein